MDLSIKWGQAVSLADLATHTGNRLSAAMWKMNFRNAATRRVDTWDYAWVASLWEHDLKVISPNRNLCLYDGFDEGTHTRRRADREQLEILPILDLENDLIEEFDSKADSWQRQFVYRETSIGLLEKAAASLFLEIERRSRRR